MARGVVIEEAKEGYRIHYYESEYRPQSRARDSHSTLQEMGDAGTSRKATAHTAQKVA
jgi:hypothetical protein